ncbi:hypothetical protein GCM10027294_54010 [Marinactinospora endophytica]
MTEIHVVLTEGGEILAAFASESEDEALRYARSASAMVESVRLYHDAHAAALDTFKREP